MFRHHSDTNTSPGHIQRYAHCKRRPTVTHRNQGPHVQRTRTKICNSLSIHLAKCQFFLLSQDQNTVGKYYELFKNQTDILTHIRAGIGNDEAIMNQVL